MNVRRWKILKQEHQLTFRVIGDVNKGFLSLNHFKRNTKEFV